MAKKMKPSKGQSYSLKSSLGKFLANRRKVQNLSQQDLASALRYETKQVISDWERGVQLPPLKKLTLIGKILKVKPDELFEKILKINQVKIVEDLRSEYAKLR